MQSLTKLLDFVFAIYATYAENFKGKKFELKNLFMLGPVFMLLPGAIASAKEAGKFWETASDIERKEAIAYIKTNLKLTDHDTEAKIEAGISILLKAGGMVEDFKALFAKSATPAVAQLAAPVEATPKAQV